MRVWWTSVIVGAVLLTGCGQPVPSEPPVATPTPSPATTSAAPSATPTPTPSPTATPAPTPSATKDVTQVVVRLADGKAEPNGERIELAKGDTVEFVVTSDRKDELHIHGMDLEIPVKPGKTVVEQVVLKQSGRFEVESHHPALVIVQLIVR